MEENRVRGGDCGRVHRSVRGGQRVEGVGEGIPLEGD
jgi:hypothetical protein